jgi:hypothetical protein
MKEFFKKYKKIIIIALIILLLLASALAIYFIFFKDKNSNSVQWEELETIDQEQNTTLPEPEFVLNSSSKAIEITYAAAKEWSNDVKLYECSAVPITVSYPEIKYENVGFKDGKYSSWMCTYYSTSKDQTRIYEYKDGVLDDSTEAIDTGEYGYLMYGDVDYPKDVSKLSDSIVVYMDAIEQGMDVEANYVNMYLTDTVSYGYVWGIEERSRTEMDEYEIGLPVHTYIYNRDTGKLIKITEEELF